MGLRTPPPPDPEARKKLLPLLRGLPERLYGRLRKPLVGPSHIPLFQIARRLPVAEKKDPHKTPPVYEIARWQTAAASTIKSSQSCKKYPARSPVTPPNSRNTIRL